MESYNTHYKYYKKLGYIKPRPEGVREKLLDGPEGISLEDFGERFKNALVEVIMSQKEAARLEQAFSEAYDGEQPLRINGKEVMPGIVSVPDQIDECIIDILGNTGTICESNQPPKIIGEYSIGKDGDLAKLAVGFGELGDLSVGVKVSNESTSDTLDFSFIRNTDGSLIYTDNVNSLIVSESEDGFSAQTQKARLVLDELRGATLFDNLRRHR